MRTALDCQFCPQFRLILTQSVFDPLTLTPLISPAPATLVTKTRLKYLKPFIVNLIPPSFRQGTLMRNRTDSDKIINNKTREERDRWISRLLCTHVLLVFPKR
ncbi:hypothetical protein Bca4012_035488 [Brassica carinata]